jgi:PAS domain S-box-containing protein
MKIPWLHGIRQKAQVVENPPETGDLERAVHIMTKAVAEIGALTQLEMVYRITGQRIQELLGDVYVSVSIREEQQNVFRVSGIYGLEKLYEDLIRRFKVNPTRIVYPESDMTPEELAYFRSGKLEKFRYGLYEIMVRKVPRYICRAAGRFLEIRSIYTMGFVMDGIHYGGIVIYGKSDTLPFLPLIEVIMNHASVKIKYLRSEAKLRRSENILRLFVTYAPANIAMFDMDMRYLAASRQYLKNFLLPENEVIGHSHYEFFPGLTQEVRSIHRRCLNGAHEQNDALLYTRSDGTSDWLKWQMFPWYEKDDQIGGVMLMSEIITDRKLADEKISALHDDLENRVRERTAELERANRELEAFAYSISHDLRAPLRAINSFTHILQEENQKQLDEEGNRVCRIIVDNASRMGTLIDDLLSFSRLGRSEMNYGPVSMNGLVAESLSELQMNENIERADLQISTLPDIQGDRAMIRQVWVNLLSNALKFSSHHTKPVIKIWGEKTENAARYHIRDNGAGFDMQYASKLFGVFQRLHSVNEFEGSGVGLAIVQRIVQRHGGTVDAEAEPGQGATFHFTVPDHVS